MSWESVSERRAIYKRYGLGLLVGAALVGGFYALRRWLRGR